MAYRISSYDIRWLFFFTNTVLRKCVHISMLESIVFIKVTIFWNVMLCCLVPTYIFMQCKIPEDCNINIQCLCTCSMYDSQALLLMS
jgi:hypothetical protein